MESLRDFVVASSPRTATGARRVYAQFCDQHKNEISPLNFTDRWYIYGYCIGFALKGGAQSHLSSTDKVYIMGIEDGKGDREDV